MVPMEELTQKWQKEQFEIASKVSVISDEAYLQSKKQQSQESAPNKKATTTTHGGFTHHRVQPAPDRLVGGVDISFGHGNSAIAVYVVLKHHKVVYKDSLAFELTQPYVSSYLAFREKDPILELVKRQMEQEPNMTPDIILVDGNGILHERRAGIACFLGVLTTIPTVGVGKTVYVTDGLDVEIVERGIESIAETFAIDLLEKESSQSEEAGDDDNKLDANDHDEMILVRSVDPIHASASSNKNTTDPPKEVNMEECMVTIGRSCDGLAIPLQGSDGAILASALVGHGGRIAKRGNSKQKKKQPQPGTKVPIYISVGHGISLQEAIEVCCDLSLARIPEPVRQADLIGRDLIRQQQKAKEGDDK